MRSIVLLLWAFSVVSAQDIVVSKKGNIKRPLSIWAKTVYEDTYASVEIREIDTFKDTVETKIPKSSIEYLVISGDTVRFSGSRDSRIDTTITIEKTPNDGAYLSITELFYNQPSRLLDGLAVDYETKAHEVLRRGAKRYSKSLEKVAFLVGKDKGLPLRGVCKNGRIYWGSSREMYILYVSPYYSFYEMKSADAGVINTGMWIGGTFAPGVQQEGIPREISKRIVVIDMKNRSEHVLTVRYLKKVLKKHDLTLYRKFQHEGRKKEKLKEYLLTLTGSLQRG